MIQYLSIVWGPHSALYQNLTSEISKIHVDAATVSCLLTETLHLTSWCYLLPFGNEEYDQRMYPSCIANSHATLTRNWLGMEPALTLTHETRGK